jgi:predicted DNA-binding protein YlxM (UPF0122 family)
LTPTQKDVFSDYYLYDLSLGEIAANRLISRAAVNDALKKGLEKMKELEKSIRYLAKKKELASLLEHYETAAADEKEAAYQKLKEYVKNGL